MLYMYNTREQKKILQRRPIMGLEHMSKPVTRCKYGNILSTP